MEISLGLFPSEEPRRLLELIALAETLGYHTVYVGDSQMIWREAFVLLGAAALTTSRIRLATGVTNPITREPAVVAAAIETLVELAGPRVILGIGAGDSSLRTLGKHPASLKQLELDPPTQRVVEQVRERYAYYEHMVPGTPHGEVVPDDLVERFAIAGTESEARAQIERLASSGLVDEIAIIPHAANPAERESIIRKVGQMLR